MENDIDVYNALARILLDNAPSEAVVVKLTFSVKIENSEMESGWDDFQFDYISNNGVESWFGIDDGKVVSEIGNLCLKLREIMSIERERWKVMEFHVDLEKHRFSADFKYD